MRLIDAETLLKEFECSMDELIKSTCHENISIEALSLLCGTQLILKAPTIETVPVKYGRWIMMDGMKPPEYHHHHQCSVCESYAPMRPPYGGKEELSPYCPACGAKMDLEGQDADRP